MVGLDLGTVCRLVSLSLVQDWRVDIGLVTNCTFMHYVDA